VPSSWSDNSFSQRFLTFSLCHILLYIPYVDAALCGVHCLNNLLQGRYFSEVDLARIAHEMDAAEKALMLAGGADSSDFLKFMAVRLFEIFSEFSFFV
jgi:hypothetical protein